MDTPDQASYLARRLLVRAADLESVLREESSGETARISRRQEMVAKILAVEAGVYDGAVIHRVEAALPRVVTSLDPSPEEQRELAAFLRAHLRLT